MNYIEQLGEKALEAKRKIATASTGEKNKVLEAIAQVLLENSDAILAENEKDIANARDNGISETMVGTYGCCFCRLQSVVSLPEQETISVFSGDSNMGIDCIGRN